MITTDCIHQGTASGRRNTEREGKVDACLGFIRQDSIDLDDAEATLASCIARLEVQIYGAWAQAERQAGTPAEVRLRQYAAYLEQSSALLNRYWASVDFDIDVTIGQAMVAYKLYQVRLQLQSKNKDELDDAIGWVTSECDVGASLNQIARAMALDPDDLRAAMLAEAGLKEESRWYRVTTLEAKTRRQIEQSSLITRTMRTAEHCAEIALAVAQAGLTDVLRRLKAFVDRVAAAITGGTRRATQALRNMRREATAAARSALAAATAVANKQLAQIAQRVYGPVGSHLPKKRLGAPHAAHALTHTPTPNHQTGGERPPATHPPKTFERMKKFITCTTIAAAAVVLTACGKAENTGSVSGASLGVTSESTSSTEGSISRELASLRKLSASRDTSYAIKMPASAVVDAALINGTNVAVMGKLRLGMADEKRSFIQDEKKLQEFQGELMQGDPLRDELVKIDQKVQAINQAYAQKMSQQAASDPPAADQEQAQWEAELNKAESLVRARLAYAIATQGQSAWEISPISRRNPFGAMPQEEQFMLTAYMRAHEIGTCVAGRIGGVVAKQLADYVLPDPTKAGGLAQKLGLAVLKDQGADVVAWCEQEFPSEAFRVKQLTGSEPGPSWIVTSRSGNRVQIECVATGCKSTSNGVVEYGESKYLGATYELAMARAVGSAEERSKSGRQGETATNGNSQGTRVGIGN